MKKYLTYFMLIALIIALCACSNVPAQTEPVPTSGNVVEDTTEHESFTEETTTTVNVPAEQMPMISVTLPIQTQSVSHENGTVLFQNIYQDISLILPDADVANKIILDFLNRTDMTEIASQLTEQAKEDYSESLEYWSPYLSRITYDPIRIDNIVLSMYGSYASYSGGAHAEATYRSVTYDILTGSVLTLDKILCDSISSDDVCQLVLQYLHNKNELYPDYENFVTNRFQKSLSNEKDWFLSDEGLCFFFSPYEIAPYASGAIVATIPYEKLLGILNDAYFPAERNAVKGEISHSLFREGDLEQYSQIAEVILDTEGEKIVLHTDGAIYDVKIQIGRWSADGSVYTPTNTIYAGYRLTPGDAIMISAHLKETLPTLHLSYTTQETSANTFISWDTQNDIPFLKDMTGF